MLFSWSNAWTYRAVQSTDPLPTTFHTNLQNKLQLHSSDICTSQKSPHVEKRSFQQSSNIRGRFRHWHVLFSIDHTTTSWGDQFCLFCLRLFTIPPSYTWPSPHWLSYQHLLNGWAAAMQCSSTLTTCSDQLVWRSTGQCIIGTQIFKIGHLGNRKRDSDNCFCFSKEWNPYQKATKTITWLFGQKFSCKYLVSYAQWFFSSRFCSQDTINISEILDSSPHPTPIHLALKCPTEFKEKTNLSAADDLAHMMHANTALDNRDWRIQDAHYHTWQCLFTHHLISYY